MVGKGAETAAGGGSEVVDFAGFLLVLLCCSTRIKPTRNEYFMNATWTEKEAIFQEQKNIGSCKQQFEF